MIDWTSVLLALAAGLPATIAAIGAVIIALYTNRKVEEVRHATNSMKDDLVRITGESEKAKGLLEGAAHERERSQREPEIM